MECVIRLCTIWDMICLIPVVDLCLFLLCLWLCWFSRLGLMICDLLGINASVLLYDVLPIGVFVWTTGVVLFYDFGVCV